MDAWRGDYQVWLLPDLKEPIRWHENKGNTEFSVLAIPAENLDRLDIYHIGSNGCAWGLHPYVRFANARVDGWLDVWLNLFRPGGGVHFYYAPESVTLAVPEFTPRGVAYRDAEFRMIPGPTWPIEGIDESSQSVMMKWPPDDRRAAPVSPEAESAEYYGPLQRGNFEGLPVATSPRDPNFRSLHVVFQLPKPFENFAPGGVGMDTLVGQARMAKIARRSADDLGAALQQARDAIGPYITEGRSTQELAWFLPTLQKEGIERALHAAWFQFNLNDHKTPEEAMQSPAWKQEMEKCVPIRRAWGVLGLFWSMLLDRLEAGETFGVCERCHRTIKGKRGKRLCGPGDDIGCFAKRRAADRRKERSVRSK
jgi:GH24 family phage-related lysozyme (muramidase)